MLAQKIDYALGKVSNMSSTTNTPFPPLPLPEGIKEFYLQTDTLNFHILSAGSPAPWESKGPSKPLILLVHGFPELAFSWRHVGPLFIHEY
jgi:hypothetical protein